MKNGKFKIVSIFCAFALSAMSAISANAMKNENYGDKDNSSNIKNQNNEDGGVLDYSETNENGVEKSHKDFGFENFNIKGDIFNARNNDSDSEEYKEIDCFLSELLNFNNKKSEKLNTDEMYETSSVYDENPEENLSRIYYGDKNIWKNDSDDSKKTNLNNFNSNNVNFNETNNNNNSNNKNNLNTNLANELYKTLKDQELDLESIKPFKPNANYKKYNEKKDENLESKKYENLKNSDYKNLKIGDYKEHFIKISSDLEEMVADGKTVNDKFIDDYVSLFYEYGNWHTKYMKFLKYVGTENCKDANDIGVKEEIDNEIRKIESNIQLMRKKYVSNFYLCNHINNKLVNYKKEFQNFSKYFNDVVFSKKEYNVEDYNSKYQAFKNLYDEFGEFKWRYGDLIGQSRMFFGVNFINLKNEISSNLDKVYLTADLGYYRREFQDFSKYFNDVVFSGKKYDEKEYDNKFNYFKKLYFEYNDYKQQYLEKIERLKEISDLKEEIFKQNCIIFATADLGYYKEKSKDFLKYFNDVVFSGEKYNKNEYEYKYNRFKDLDSEFKRYNEKNSLIIRENSELNKLKEKIFDILKKIYVTVNSNHYKDKFQDFLKYFNYVITSKEKFDKEGFITKKSDYMKVCSEFKDHNNRYEYIINRNDKFVKLQEEIFKIQEKIDNILNRSNSVRYINRSNSVRYINKKPLDNKEISLNKKTNSGKDINRIMLNKNSNYMGRSSDFEKELTAYEKEFQDTLRYFNDVIASKEKIDEEVIDFKENFFDELRKNFLGYFSGNRKVIFTYGNCFELKSKIFRLIDEIKFKINTVRSKNVNIKAETDNSSLIERSKYSSDINKNLNYIDKISDLNSILTHYKKQFEDFLKYLNDVLNSEIKFDRGAFDLEKEYCDKQLCYNCKTYIKNNEKEINGNKELSDLKDEIIANIDDIRKKINTIEIKNADIKRGTDYNNNLNTRAIFSRDINKKPLNNNFNKLNRRANSVKEINKKLLNNNEVSLNRKVNSSKRINKITLNENDSKNIGKKFNSNNININKNLNYINNSNDVHEKLTSYKEQFQNILNQLEDIKNNEKDGTVNSYNNLTLKYNVYMNTNIKNFEEDMVFNNLKNEISQIIIKINEKVKNVENNSLKAYSSQNQKKYNRENNKYRHKNHYVEEQYYGNKGNFKYRDNKNKTRYFLDKKGIYRFNEKNNKNK